MIRGNYIYFREIMYSYEAKNIEKLKQFCLNSGFSRTSLMFCMKLAPQNIHIDDFIGQSYNRPN